MKIGPYEVAEKIRKINYRLKLLLIIRIYTVFHVALLEEALREMELDTTITIINNEEEEYEVEQILNY